MSALPELAWFALALTVLFFQRAPLLPLRYLLTRFEYAVFDEASPMLAPGEIL